MAEKENFTGASTTTSTNNQSEDDEHTIADDGSDAGSTSDRQSNRSLSDRESGGTHTDGSGDLNSADDSSESNDEDLVVLNGQEIGVLIAKCRKLISKFSKSSILDDTLLDLARDPVSIDLVPDMRIRWNSTYQLIQWLLPYQHVLAAFYAGLNTLDGVTLNQRKKLVNVKLTSLDWNILLAIRRVLERFNDATEILLGKSSPTLSLGYSVVYSLYNYWNDRAGDATENAVKEMMVEKRSDYVLPVPDTKQADVPLSVAFIDTLVHDMLSSQHQSKIENFLLNGIRKYQNTNSITQKASLSVPVIGNIAIHIAQKQQDVETF